MGTNVYVGRIPNKAREKDIERFLKGFGKVKSIDLKRGYGFVEFEDTRDADDAVYELNGKNLCGERIIIEHARGPSRRGGRDGGFQRNGSSRDHFRNNYRENTREKSTWIDKYGPPTRTENRVTVQNLSSRVSWQDLKDYMRQAGEVTYADAHKLNRNEGVVEFATSADLKNAIDKLDKTEINGRRIRIVPDKSRNRAKSYSRSRSRSRSRSNNYTRKISHSKSRSKSASRSRSHSISKNPGRSRSRSISQSD